MVIVTVEPAVGQPLGRKETRRALADGPFDWRLPLSAGSGAEAVHVAR